MTEPSTMERIVGATLELVAERGLGNVTMSDIAKHAGVARQTLYNHFADTDSIVAHAIREHNEEGIAQLHAAAAVVDRPSDKITQIARHLAQTATHGRHTLDFEHSLAPEHRGLFTDYTRALDELLEAIITEGVTTQAFRADLTSNLDAVLVRHQLTGLTRLIADQPDDIARITEHTTSTILSGLQRRPGR